VDEGGPGERPNHDSKLARTCCDAAVARSPVEAAGAAAAITPTTTAILSIERRRSRAGIALVYKPVVRSRSEVSRRQFLKAAAGAAWLPSLGFQTGAGAQTLHNGIVLTRPWPPRRADWIGQPEQPPYLLSPPAIIPIDVGRQLLVDDFLIEQSSLYREFHAATYHDANPILQPDRPWEQQDPHAELAGYPPSAAAMVFSDGVFFDPDERVFKMWYMAGYQNHTALAVSRDGLAWDKPSLSIVRGTNLVSTDRRDSSTTWLDLSARDERARYKQASYSLEHKALALSESADGIHWRRAGMSGPCGDRSTFFRNPVRDAWVFSLRHDIAGLNRTRQYVESPSFATATWDARAPVSWIGADALDHVDPAVPTTRPELYNLDAVAYESLFIGLFDIYRGEPRDREKPNDLCIGFSRDGFHWSRLSRAPFIRVSNTRGAWNFSNVQSAGGCCLVVGDRLHFYVSGRQGIEGTSLPGRCSTGLATLRRDGFSSLSDRWPAGIARAISGPPGTLITRPLRFSGSQLFVNAQIDGELRAEVLDISGRPIDGFGIDRAIAVRGDATRLPVTWSGGASLAALANTPVRLRFTLNRARLFSFWISRSPRGESAGYMAAGGPGIGGERDL
jgi:hypothetical protein